jgi:hypothetical protein
MTKREEVIGALICDEIRKQISEMDWTELIHLRVAYDKGKPYSELSPKLRERFKDIGVGFLRRLPTLG